MKVPLVCKKLVFLAETPKSAGKYRTDRGWKTNAKQNENLSISLYPQVPYQDSFMIMTQYLILPKAITLNITIIKENRSQQICKTKF